jgi:hypothetical protein
MIGTFGNRFSNSYFQLSLLIVCPAAKPNAK